MEENNKTQPQYIYVQSPNHYAEDETEIDLLELFSAVWKKKWFIIFVTFIFSAAALAYSMYLPFIYRGVVKFTPQQGSRAASLMAQYGGMASMLGISLPGGATSPGQTMLALIKSDSVVDTMIDKYNLMEENEWEYRINAREDFIKTYVETNEDTQTGIITVACLHEDPQIAADMANTLVDELQKKIAAMSLADAQQRTKFFEAQTLQTLQELTTAEENLMNYQKSSGVVELTEQSKGLFTSIATLNDRIAAKNIEISSMRSYLKSDNPRLKLAESQLQAMQDELKKLEAEQKSKDGGRGLGASKEIGFSVEAIPELGVEYQRYVRELRLAGAKYETMIKNYEAAKLAELTDFSTISIIDYATPPDYKYKPKRARICIMGFLLGGFLSTMYAAWPNLKKQMFADRKKDEDDEDYDDD